MGFAELDASSAFQDSLPVTSDQLLEMLTNEGFFYQRIDHIPLRTVADSKKVRDGFLTTQQGGGHIKNLFLRDKKKNNFLLVLPEDAELDLKALSAVIGGVDSLLVTPSDEAKPDDPFARRMARNVQHLLQAESYLNRVVDPAAGAYYIEHMTERIAEQAWQQFCKM